MVCVTKTPVAVTAKRQSAIHFHAEFRGRAPAALAPAAAEGLGATGGGSGGGSGGGAAWRGCPDGFVAASDAGSIMRCFHSWQREVWQYRRSYIWHVSGAPTSVRRTVKWSWRFRQSRVRSEFDRSCGINPAPRHDRSSHPTNHESRSNCSICATIAGSIRIKGGQGRLNPSPGNFLVASIPNLLPMAISLVA
jgi:hypothetical protein